ncbi:MAG: peroxiredoxin [Gammaproteobacteria bacterium]
MLKKGDRAPDFTLTDQYGERRQLSELLHDGPVVVYFYPADFTPGCTKEACGLRDMNQELIRSGLRVVGISPQDAESHQRFGEKHQLPFPLLADTDKTVIRAYGVDGPLGFGVRRATFLVARDGLIRNSVLADFRIGEHLEFVNAAIADMDA